MTNDRSRGNRWWRRCAALAVLLFCLPVSGCGLLLDEFTLLDRGPPPIVDPAESISVP